MPPFSRQAKSIGLLYPHFITSFAVSSFLFHLVPSMN